MAAKCIKCMRARGVHLVTGGYACTRCYYDIVDAIHEEERKDVTTDKDD